MYICFILHQNVALLFLFNCHFFMLGTSKKSKWVSWHCQALLCYCHQLLIAEMAFSYHFIVFLLFPCILFGSFTEPPQIAKFQPLISLSSGSQFLLTCHVSRGFDKMLQFKWRFNGKNIDHNLMDHSRFQIDTKSTFSLFTLNQVEPRDSGNYSCVVNSDLTNMFDSQWSILEVKGQWVAYFQSICSLWRIFPKRGAKLSVKNVGGWIYCDHLQKNVFVARVRLWKLFQNDLDLCLCS